MTPIILYCKLRRGIFYLRRHCNQRITIQRQIFGLLQRQLDERLERSFHQRWKNQHSRDLFETVRQELYEIRWCSIRVNIQIKNYFTMLAIKMNFHAFIEFSAFVITVTLVCMARVTKKTAALDVQVTRNKFVVEIGATVFTN